MHEAEEDEEVWKKKFEGLKKRVAYIDSRRAVSRACIDRSTNRVSNLAKVKDKKI